MTEGFRLIEVPSWTNFPLQFGGYSLRRNGCHDLFTSSSTRFSSIIYFWLFVWFTEGEVAV
jgi:hypothetical protein